MWMIEARLANVLPDEPASGIYVAASGSQAYSILSAMVTAGDAEYLGERREADGVSYIAAAYKKKVKSGPLGNLIEANGDLRKNAQIGIGAQFFSTALRTYRGWREAWWREAIQNSVDAGASKITCSVTKDGDRNVRVSVEDNGGGMDRDTLINKFLVLGGTTKQAGGSTGGFGKAKELLILPWLGWEIHTRDTLISGTNISYDEQGASSLSGLRLTVTMPPDETTDISAAIAFVSKCYLPGVKFTFIGDEGEISVSADSKPNLAPGEPFRVLEDKVELSFVKGYEKKARYPGLLLVRAKSANGTGSLFMWEEYVPEAIKGQMLVEIIGPTIKLLNDNRQSWRDWDIESAVSRFKSELAADVKSALRGKEKIERIKYEGSGKFVAKKVTSVRCAIEESVVISYPKEGKTVDLSKGQVDKILDMLAHLGDSEQEEAGEMPLAYVRGSAEAILSSVEIAGPAHVRAIAKQMSWQPDFYLYSQIKGYKIPKKFKPEGMSDDMFKLAKMWAETCRLVLANLGSSAEYGVGFLFDNGEDSYGGVSQAMCLKDGDGDSWLLLNPFKDKEMEELRRVSSKEDIDMILAFAIHECTHLFDEISRHDESFTSAFTVNVGKCARLIDVMPKIKRAVYSELKEKKQPARPKAKREELGGYVDFYEITPLSSARVIEWDVNSWEHGAGVALETPSGVYYEMWIESIGRTGKGTFARVSDRQACFIDKRLAARDPEDYYGKLRDLLKKTFVEAPPGDFAGVTYDTLVSWEKAYHRWAPFDVNSVVEESPFVR